MILQKIVNYGTMTKHYYATGVMYMLDIEQAFRNVCDRMEQQNVPVEGFAVMDQNATVLFEERWIQDIPRDIYSNTKSFTGLAIGIAVSMGVLSLEDSVADCFKDELPPDHSPALEAMKLKHLLTMSSGFDQRLLMYPDRRRGVGFPDYLQYLLSREVHQTPGTKYCYSSGDSILAGRMCEKATGKGLAQFLYETFFEKIGIQFPLWEHCPMGHACGASGMHLTLTEMMLLGVVYLNGGVFQSQRIVGADWVRSATAKQIDIDLGNFWGYGYGYFLKILHGGKGYRASGAFGQETIVIPNEKIVLGFQCAYGTDFSLVKQIVREEFF